MKKKLTLLFVVFPVWLFAQQQLVFKAGLNRSLYGSGDLQGIEYFNELLIPIASHFSVAPSFHIGSGSNNPTDEFTPRFTTSSFGLDALLYASPWKFNKSKLQFGVGPTVRHFSSGYPTTWVSRPTQFGNQVISVYNFYYSRNPRYISVGYSLVLDGEVNLTPKWGIGSRLSFSNYRSGETIAQYGVTLLRRF
jgi:hypothetical protein